eukprot:Skav223926  [mRNA]  locus=scaffold2593:373989:374327:- [translate_table: standard]
MSVMVVMPTVAPIEDPTTVMLLVVMPVVMALLAVVAPLAVVAAVLMDMVRMVRVVRNVVRVVHRTAAEPNMAVRHGKGAGSVQCLTRDWPRSGDGNALPYTAICTANGPLVF